MKPTLWTDKDPRAVTPGSSLVNCAEPMPATYESTVEAPFPLGVGVQVVDGGKRRSLKLIHVSRRAAKSRGVQAGWYVGAEMGRSFEVVVTNVHAENDVRTCGSLLPAEQVAVAFLDVDGVSVTPGTCDYYLGHRQLRYSGFVLQRSRGTLKTRPFVFRDAVSADGMGGGAGEHMGSITLRMHLATFTKKCEMAPAVDRRLQPAAAVNERVAKKEGFGVRVLDDEKNDMLTVDADQKPGKQMMIVANLGSVKFISDSLSGLARAGLLASTATRGVRCPLQRTRGCPIKL